MAGRINRISDLILSVLARTFVLSKQWSLVDVVKAGSLVSSKDKKFMAGRTDLISDLPLSVLHHILSYLPDKDSARTCVLSKRWSSVRKSFPFVYFKQPDEMRNMAIDGPEFKEQLGELLDSVDRSLQFFVRNKLCIGKFVLHASSMNYDSVPVVDAWLSLALHNGVSELCFYVNAISRESAYSHYALPETTFALNSSLLIGSSKFFRLEKLTLKMVYLSENIVRDIVRNCPGISVLCLESICGLKTLNISKLDKLVSVTVSVAASCDTLKSVSVDALSLEHFSFSIQQLHMQWEMTCCSNLRKLELSNTRISDAKFHEQISKFPLLEILDISFCYDLRRIRISLQRLKHLRIHHCYTIIAIEIVAPALSSFAFYSNHEWPDIVLSKLSYDPYKSSKPAIPPRFEVGCLDLTRLVSVPSWWWELTLDNLLSSYHPTIISLGTDWLKILCKMLMQRERKYRSCRRRCECWRHRLKEAKFESIREYGILEYKQFPHALDTPLPNPSSFYEVRLRLDWDLSAIEGSCHGLDFLDNISLGTRI